jgi:hypothetical protein
MPAELSSKGGRELFRFHRKADAVSQWFCVELGYQFLSQLDHLSWICFILDLAR